MNQTGKFLGTRKCDGFFAAQKERYFAVSFDDVRLVTDYSEILPTQTSLKSHFSRNVGLNTPIVSSPMDTVTEYKMGIAIAMDGGLGIIHKGLDPITQAAHVAKVKHRLNVFLTDPICIKSDDKVADILRMKEAKDYGFSSFPVMDNNGRIVGIVTSNDFEFCPDIENSFISDIMSSQLISALPGTNVMEAYSIMCKHHKKILPIFDDSRNLQGIYTLADVKRKITNNIEGYNLDKNGSLFVGAAVGVSADDRERAELLVQKGVDVLVIDTAHGNSLGVVEMLKYLKKTYSNIDVVAGNISEGEAAKRLVAAGADGLRIGQGPGSICTTRITAGIGHPQVSAIYECEKAIRGSGVPICADGGIRYSGDIAVAMGAGADSVMLGNLLAGTTESPGDVFFKNGKAVKVYRGMGSLEAMKEHKTSRQRYGQIEGGTDKLVPEGVSGEVLFKGEVHAVLHQLLGGLRAGLGYLGVKEVSFLKENADFHLVSNSGMQESHPHDLFSMNEAPNYRSPR
ncbi:MAG: IMP dehydrogenase [Candidatus Falkowbacteria bacterium]|nr:MAG: IMP dehydrogenase [Candidatus Falkowbacteria bacterium]